MRLTHRHIEIFNAVMTAGSVSKAAELLCTSQPTVSRELARIEQLTGFSLFERVKGRLKATTSAYVLFEEIKRSYVGLEHIHSLIESIREQRSGQISLITLPDFAQSLLPGVCASFNKISPDVSISISVQESPFLEQCLSSQQFDLGLTESDIAPPGTEARQLLTANEVCILPAGHPLLEKEIIDIEDFQDQAFISFSENDPYKIRFDEIISNAGVTYKQVIQTPTAISVCSFVRRGVGIALINPLTALDYLGDDLHMRPLSFLCPFSINVVTPSHRVANPFLHAFIQELEKEILRIKRLL